MEEQMQITNQFVNTSFSRSSKGVFLFPFFSLFRSAGTCFLFLFFNFFLFFYIIFFFYKQTKDYRKHDRYIVIFICAL